MRALWNFDGPQNGLQSGPIITVDITINVTRTYAHIRRSFVLVPEGEGSGPTLDQFYVPLKRVSIKCDHKNIFHYPHINPYKAMLNQYKAMLNQSRVLRYLSIFAMHDA